MAGIPITSLPNLSNPPLNALLIVDNANNTYNSTVASVLAANSTVVTPVFGYGYGGNPFGNQLPAAHVVGFPSSNQAFSFAANLNNNFGTNGTPNGIAISDGANAIFWGLNSSGVVLLTNGPLTSVMTNSIYSSAQMNGHGQGGFTGTVYNTETNASHLFGIKGFISKTTQNDSSAEAYFAFYFDQVKLINVSINNPSFPGVMLNLNATLDFFLAYPSGTVCKLCQYNFSPSILP